MTRRTRPWRKVLRRDVDQVLVDPRRKQIIYALAGSGQPRMSNCFPERLLRTSDGGRAWKTLYGLPQEIAGVAISPVDGSLYAWTDWTIFRSRNDGGSWTQFRSAVLTHFRQGCLVSTYRHGRVLLKGHS
jgi:hypothetical protein